MHCRGLCCKPGSRCAWACMGPQESIRSHGDRIGLERQTNACVMVLARGLERGAYMAAA